MPSLLKQLGISSPQEAAELEHDLGIRFDDLTPQQRETWKQQTVYLGLYAEINNSTRAARAAGVTVRTVRKWQAQDTLGFNDRLELAVLEYTEEIDYILLEHIRKPDCSPSLLTMFVRANMPEKYGAIRRGNTSHSGHCDHHHDPSPSPVLGEGWGEGDNPSTPPALNPPTSAEGNPPTPSPVLGESLPRTGYGGWAEGSNPSAEIPHSFHPRRRVASPVPGEPWAEGDNPSTPSAPSIMNPPTLEKTQAEGSPPTPSTTNPPNTQHLNRRQRRQLQRQNRKNKSKQPNSHRPRAPTMPS